jgi:NAD(P)-dependent dehydrogenase (short-subunit alcohol dehydrogenase family)
MGSLEGKVAIVTGATHGIGRAIALAFADESARVVGCGRDEKALASLQADLGSRGTAHRADVGNEVDIEVAVAAAIGEYGGLDIALNAAGTGGAMSTVRNNDLKIAEDIWRTNVLGVLACMKHESRAMRQRGAGSIINISSLSGKMPAKGMAAYCGSKAAVNMMTEVAALEMGEFNIRVNCIGPGAIDTRMTEWMKIPGVGEAIISETPLGRVGRTGDLTAMAVYLASEASSFVTGQTFYADGGASLMRYPDIPKLFRGAPGPA